ncbi:MAG: NADH-quinone oxidoreductase subunit N [Bryobacteraceae bacterium]
MIGAADLIALLPLLFVAGGSVAAMLAIAIRRSHVLVAGLTVAALAGAFGCLWIAAAAAPRRVTALLIVDGYALFFMALLIGATAAVALLGYGYLEMRAGRREEFYVLLLTGTLGAMVLAASSHLASFFLGLEILTVSLYALIAYLPARRVSLEAGIKYLILAASSAAFLLFGMALVYAAAGTMDLTGMLAAGADDILFVPGLILIVTGIGFKLAVVPFHMWTPDVYQGAPAPIAAYIATVSKGAMFALLLRYYFASGARHAGAVFLIFSIIAISSMIAGNLLALLQTNVKRILAYSSIAHMGYLLVAFLASGELAMQAAMFYLVAYLVSTLGAFGIVSVLSSAESEAETLEDYRGLFWRRPALAGVFTAMLLSLAGIPLTAGFIGKFYVVSAGASSTLWALIVILAITSGVGIFYYLRIVAAMCGSAAEISEPRTAMPAGVVLTAATAFLLWFGIYPAPLLNAIRAALSQLIA